MVQKGRSWVHRRCSYGRVLIEQSDGISLEEAVLFKVSTLRPDEWGTKGERRWLPGR